MDKPEDIVNHLKDVNKSLEDLIQFTKNRIDWMKNQMIQSSPPVTTPKAIERDSAYYKLISKINYNLN